MEKYIKELEGTIHLPDRMRRSLLDFARGIRVLVDEERQKQNPDDSLITILCEAGRLGYRYLADLQSQSEQIAKEIVDAIPEQDIKDFSKTFVVATKASKPILDAILTERFNQDEKQGELNHGDHFWVGELLEQIGAAIKTWHVGQEDLLRARVVEVAAVAVAWLECMKRREDRALESLIVSALRLGEDRPLTEEDLAEENLPKLTEEELAYFNKMGPLDLKRLQEKYGKGGPE